MSDAGDSRSALSWRNGSYKAFLAGQAMSAIGNGVTFTVLPLVVVELTRSGFRLGLLGLLQTLPSLVVGLAAGWAADRWDRRRLMIACDLGRCVLVAAIPIAAYAGLPVIGVIYLAVVPYSVLTPPFLAAYTAAVPQVVGREHVPKATAELQAVAAIGFVSGPALAAGFIVAFSPVSALWVDAASFAASACCLALVRRPLQGACESSAGSMLSGISEGVSFVRRTPSLRALIGFWTAVSGATVLLIPAVAYVIDIERKLSSWSFPVTVAMFSVGAVAGFAVAARLSRLAAGRPMLAACVLAGGAIITIVHLRGIVPLLAGAALAGAGSGCVTCLYVAIRTSLTPDRLLGRIGSISELVTDAVSPLVLLFGGVLLDVLGGTTVVTAVGIIFVVAGAGFALAPSIRGVRADDTSAAAPVPALAARAEAQ